MPAKGKHRRPRNNPIVRGFVVAGTGGAALAIPLVGATGAHAAEQTGAPSSVTAASAASVAHTAAAPAGQRAGTKRGSVYTVKPGDYLARIAQTHHVRGGWHTLYEDNREAVGDNPSLIHPGLKLTIGAQAKATAGGRADGAAKKKAAPAKPAPAKPAPARPAPKADTAADTAPDTTAAQPAAPSAASGYTAPVDGAAITTQYRASGSSWASGYHTGVDFAVGTGTTVKAVAPGTVVSAGWAGSYGNEVVIRHDDGQYSQYGHLSSISVSAGQSVGAGDQIGLSGSTGNSTGPHLHFEIRTGPGYGSDVDPLAYLREHGVSL
ncbi:LysM peptidoglycan-binding domain-containing M23 family metallopeptidase [Streptomyces sp. NBC_01498]|uniref:LysM peptidoglycan-binding domain-containing M23 family metallopeptidase n=1 Tax=Streptomyces sp. NBC_01498 TaxID=2975870 RepID=UPI002E7BAD3D|nr:LysM peptidoglycan-binding domain-containing M23 family metallopeptidase [Streptomyces sp. NBC_01498]WTL23656.1 LysM peptidoglycan-binding domain-containing M23 family metallopeptidase [Streptomyces sp. NBC_01498]